MEASSYRTTIVLAVVLIVGSGVAGAVTALSDGPGSPALDSVGSPVSLGQQDQANLEVARTLLATQPSAAGDDLTRATSVAPAISSWQVGTLGLEEADPVPLAGYEVPSRALADLAAGQGVELTPDQLQEVRALDDLPRPVALALARTVDAFLALDAAAGSAYEDVDQETLAGLEATYPTLGLQASQTPLQPGTPEAAIQPGEVLAEAGVDLAQVLATRSQFLDAVVDLERALDSVAVTQAQACSPVAVAPAFSIDLTACDNTYNQSVALQLDAGGNDAYNNNAGGNNLGPLVDDCLLAARTPAAALVDLGSGTDAYGDAASPGRCGVNGGGFLGVGFLFDGGGSDGYTALSNGVNGGSFLGSGFLLDAGGHDTYNAGSDGANGGANGGTGLLVDLDGDDTYDAGSFGINGGGSLGVGSLVDLDGDDTYAGGNNGVNGGGVLGVGLLVDAFGDDSYTATSFGTNGGGNGGVGFLLDDGGDDTYTAGSDGANGGGLLGTGLLLDTGGEDAYDDALVTCLDCTVVPKGLVGAQIDSDDTL